MEWASQLQFVFHVEKLVTSPLFRDPTLFPPLRSQLSLQSIVIFPAVIACNRTQI